MNKTASRAAAQSPCRDIDKLHNLIRDIDSLSQQSLSEIQAIAKLAMLALEHPDGLRDTETIAHALHAIWGKAHETEDLINCRCEEVGSNWVDKSMLRRFAAHRAVHEGAAL